MSAWRSGAFSVQTFNAIAKKVDAKAKDGETAGLEIRMMIHELHHPWNYRGAEPRQTQSWHP
jgi:hypothetical protein